MKVVGVEKNPESALRARANIRNAGLENQIEIIEGDIFQLNKIPGKFDYVLAEAILTMQSPPGKAKILSQIHNKLKTKGLFLSHELLANGKEEEIHTDLARVLRYNSKPLSQANWNAVFASAGLQLQQQKIGKMSLLNLGQMFQDEGVLSTIRILWNIFTHKPIRQRVWEMRRIFHKYNNELGYIIICAIAQ